MAGINASINLQDNFTAVLNKIIGAVNTSISAMQQMNSAMNNPVDTQTWENARDQIAQAGAGLRQMEAAQEDLNDAAEKGNVSFGNLLGKVTGMVTGYLSLRSAISFVKDSLSAFNTQLSSEAQLSSTLANMVGSEWETAFDRIKKKASEIQEQGIYGDEAMIAAGAEFATYMTDTSAIEKMMDTLSNYAMGMTGGAELSKDELLNYATNLGKITVGSFDAMNEKGFEFTEAQKAIIKGTATQSQMVEALGKDYENMSADMQSATVIADVINEAWGGMYGTMSDTPQGKITQLSNAWGDMKEVVGKQLYPFVIRLVDALNSNWGTIQSGVLAVIGVFQNFIALLGTGLSMVLEFAQYISDNWSIIRPIVLGITAAIAAYTIATGVLAAKTAILNAKQAILNSTLLASPITWYVAGIIAIIAVLGVLSNWIAKITGAAQSGLGIITGGVNVAIQAVKNAALVVANVGIGIWSALGAVCENIGTAFHNVIANIQSWFYNLLSTALTVVAGICEALNKLPFVNFDYSGIVAKADEYAAKSSEAAGNKKEYKSIADAFSEGYGSYEVFGEGWQDEAFKAGANWGDGIAEKLNGLLKFSDVGDESTSFSMESILSNTSDIADSASSASKSLSASTEDLKYLRDIAEQETINRFTTAEVRVDLGGVTNNVSKNVDLDGIIDYLTTGVSEALQIAADGVY